MKSFYDLDYIIEINEKRIEQLSATYQKVLERITNILLIYSGISIFLISIIQDIFWKEFSHWIFLLAFAFFSSFFIATVYYTVRLLIPVKIAYLEPPQKFYIEYRSIYEQTITDQVSISNLLKASYIEALERTLNANTAIFRRKNSFYYNALIYALLSAVPFLICISFHVLKKEEKIHKVEIVNSHNSK